MVVNFSTESSYFAIQARTLLRPQPSRNAPANLKSKQARQRLPVRFRRTQPSAVCRHFSKLLRNLSKRPYFDCRSIRNAALVKPLDTFNPSRELS